MKILIQSLFFILVLSQVAFALPGKIDGHENLPPSLKTFLYEEQVLHNKALWPENSFASNIAKEYLPENRPKFPLPYYLIPEEHARFLQVKSLNGEVKSQISVTINNKTYYKLFVHPESEAHYEFLRKEFTYVGPEQTELMASPTASYRSLLVWNNSDTTQRPFVAKVSLDRNVIGGIDRLVSTAEVERSMANQKAFDLIGKAKQEQMHQKIYPETAGLILEGVDYFPGKPEKLGGQLIREIPQEMISGETRFISFSALMSPENGKPLILKILENSKLTSEQFAKDYLINSYMKMFEQLSLVEGINFEPHSQNLSIEVTKDLRLTGNWVIRDFGGVWPDIVTMARNNGPVKAYIDGNSKTYKFAQGRANSLSSYVYFYRRQVFDLLLEQIAQHDHTLRSKIPDLREALDKKFVDSMQKNQQLSLGSAPTMDNLKKIEASFAQNSILVPDKTKMIDGTQSQTIQKMLNTKKLAGEYVELRKNSPSWNPIEILRSVLENGFGTSNKIYVTPEVLIVVNSSNSILGFTVLNSEEIKSLKSSSSYKTLIQSRVKQDIKPVGAKMCSGLFGLAG